MRTSTSSDLREDFSDDQFGDPGVRLPARPPLEGQRTPDGSLYTDVATRAKNAGVVVTHKYPDVEGSIPIPAKFTIELGERMQDLAERDDRGKGLGRSFMQLNLYSDHPFRRRNDSPPKQQFGKDALGFYRDERNKELPFDRIEKTRAGRPGAPPRHAAGHGGAMPEVPQRPQAL